MPSDDERPLYATTLQNVQAILEASQRAEQELRTTKEALEEETRILELLNRTGSMLASKLDLQSVVQAVTDAATELSGAQFGAFFYTATNDDGGVFTLYALSGAPREAFERFGQPRATPIFAPTFNGEAVIRLDDVRADPRYGRMAPHHGMPPGHLPVCSYLAVPVVSRSGDVLGGLFFGHSEAGVFTERSERLIVGVAAQAAVAIDNARLYEQAKRAADERARLLEAERAARAEVERVSLLKDEFLATLSHELRTPLNAILGWALMLQRGGLGDEQRKRAFDTIERNARAQAHLIEDLLDMNRIMSGKVRLEVQRVGLAAVVSAALDSVRPSAEAKGIALHTPVDPGVGLVSGDPNRLQQIVWNLLTNAVKFTPKGGAIEVTLRATDVHAEVIVRDSGVGIREAFLPHVFERFRQADSSTTRHYGGLGLGLSIVKQLVELHGGSVAAESAGHGLGSTFRVSLPLGALRDDGPVLRGSVTSERAPSGGGGEEVSLDGVTVLVVDDEPDTRELLHSVLAAAAASVLVGASADEALALLKAHRPDVVVSDIGMPGRDGYEFIRDVRRLDPQAGGRTPAIALTAFARSTDRTRAMLAGYQVHVSKPIEPQELVATIRSLAGDRGEPPR